MKVNIQTPGLNAKQELLDFTFQKAAKLFLLYRKLIRVDVVLAISNASTGKNKTVRIRLVMPGNDLITTSVGQSFEEAVIKTIDMLKEQLRKRKIMQRTHRRNSVTMW